VVTSQKKKAWLNKKATNCKTTLEVVLKKKRKTAERKRVNSLKIWLITFDRRNKRITYKMKLLEKYKYFKYKISLQENIMM